MVDLVDSLNSLLLRPMLQPLVKSTTTRIVHVSLAKACDGEFLNNPYVRARISEEIVLMS